VEKEKLIGAFIVDTGQVLPDVVAVIMNMAETV
jgi:hypothetical protein